ncbi:MAG: GyrI-like domain-containing protein [Erysipelotrichaceae bacterium]
MKYEWKLKDKDLYLPKHRPSVIDVPAMRFLTITGKGNPNDNPEFSEAVTALYSASYAIKMSWKRIKGNQDYTVFPLEGIWDLTEEGRNKTELDKNDFVFTLMIRQPDFVPDEYIYEMIEQTKIKKDVPRLDQLKLETIHDGLCLQMMHKGPFDDEPASFAWMKEIQTEEGYTRLSMTHREIYISDMRKTKPEKLKTVLRYQIKK